MPYIHFSRTESKLASRAVLSLVPCAHFLGQREQGMQASVPRWTTARCCFWALWCYSGSQALIPAGNVALLYSYERKLHRDKTEVWGREGDMGRYGGLTWSLLQKQTHLWAYMAMLFFFCFFCSWVGLSPSLHLKKIKTNDNYTPKNVSYIAYFYCKQ